jgi:hypothetical protein
MNVDLFNGLPFLRNRVENFQKNGKKTANSLSIGAEKRQQGHLEGKRPTGSDFTTTTPAGKTKKA